MARPPMTPRKKRWRTRWRHRKLGFWLRKARGRRPGQNACPIRILFPPESGVTPDDRPPVRIFIGAEVGQERAERVLIWSILKHRQPSRSYEVHLMKDIAGFQHDAWKTGFSHYRYAIPDFAGAAGRAIYNDVDQVYLADPAELFDLDMGGAGAMDIDGHDTSVMLIDCARMADVWPRAFAEAGERRHKDFRARRNEAEAWGPVDPAWNARDDEYQAGGSKLLHFTTLQTQPWRPFPKELRYGPHPQAALWLALEAEADAVGFQVPDGA